MPSRQPPSSPPAPSHSTLLLLTLLTGAALLLALTFYLIQKLIYKRVATAPSTLTRFPHSLLRRATASFSAANRIGQGGTGSVYKATLQDGTPIAVKVIDAGTLQARTEFQNEILTLSRIRNSSDKIVKTLGFAESRGRDELAIVYELMENGSLQEALLERRCVDELKDWGVRFGILMDVAEAICFLHNFVDGEIVHGDVKASNVLLDCQFRAKIADFGLAKVRCVDEDCGDLKLECVNGEGSENGGGGGSSDLSLKVFERGLIGYSSNSLSSKKCVFGKDWWWRRKENSVGGDLRFEVYDDELKVVVKMDQKAERVPKEWWKEEFVEEIEKKKLANRGAEVSSNGSGSIGGELSCESRDVTAGRTKKWKSMSNVILCYKGLSFDVLKKRRNCEDSANGELDTPRSHFTSTPSMKGTVCYTAPEYSSGQLTEKCDVYSFGVLLLVLVSGRRPLEMTTSWPMRDFERANLVSWARQLAQSDNLLDLVDPNIQSLDKEQGMRCLTVALLCLQRDPKKRPTMKEIVGMLLGSCSDSPQLPLQFSPSNFTFMSPSIPIPR